MVFIIIMNIIMYGNWKRIILNTNVKRVSDVITIYAIHGHG